MIIFGYAKQYYYSGDGTLNIQVRIPSIHGPIDQREYRGQSVRNYTKDNELPYYPSLLLPSLPNKDDVVALATLNDSPNQWLVIGLTGGSYIATITN